MNNDQIKKIMLENGFTLKPQSDGSMDLNPYVYEAARALIAQGVLQATTDTRESMSPGSPKWLCRVTDLENWALKLNN